MTYYGIVRRLYIGIVMLVISLLFALPIAFVVWTSFRSYGSILAGQFTTFHYTLENYINVLFNPGYAITKGLWNSLIASSLSTLLAIAIAIPAAYAVARLNIGGGSLISFVLSMRLLPPIIFAIPLFVLLNFTGLIDNVVGLIVIYTTFNIPLSFLVLRSFVLDIPSEIEESAMIDGCDRFGVLRHITLPLLRPGLVAAGILCFIFTWSEYLFALLFTIKNAVTINVVASQFVTQQAIRYGEIASAVTIGMIPNIIFLLLIQRYLVRGLTMGALRG
jgi:multiple sugar transport system permease protein